MWHMNRIYSHIYKGLAVLSIVTVLHSCSLFGAIDSPEDKDNISFTVSEWISTKGAITTEATIEDFGLYGYLFSAPWDAFNKPDFICNEKVTRSSGWATQYFYPNDGRYLRFYAYSPYGCAGLTLPDATTPGAIRIKYTVPESVENQKDLMVSISDDILGRGATGSINMTFHHTLTAVRFATGPEIKEGMIKSIRIRGIYNTGTLVYGETPTAKSTWYLGETKGDFTLNDLNKAVDAGSENVSITNQDQYFMLLPQTLPSGAALEIVFFDGTKDHVLTKLIEGQTWPQGEIVTYKISTTSI